jgi:hypothetical protein
MKIDEKSALELAYTFGLKLFELQQGFASMFNLCLEARVFTDERFHEEREHIMTFPDMKKFAELLESLRNSKAEADFEEALRKYKGPIQ